MKRAGIFLGLLPGVSHAHSLLRRFFDLIDGDQDGLLQQRELLSHFEASGIAHGPAPTDAPLRIFPGFEAGGEDGSWSLTWEKFQGVLQPLEMVFGHHGAPEQVHLAPTGDPTEMRVTFVTLGSTELPSAGQEPQVVVQDAQGEVRTFKASSQHYDVPSKYWQPRGWIGLVHTAVVTGLEQGHHYVYHVEANGQSSEMLSFQAAPSPSEKVAFATFGDMGTVIPAGWWVTQKLIQEQKQRPVSLVFHQGDISYAGIDRNFPHLGITSQDEWEFVWDLFGRQIAPVASAIPWVTGVGNHEAWYNWSAFVTRYPMPGRSAGSSPPFWFSFDWGPVHFTSVSSEHDYSPGSAQLEWVERDLANAASNRDTVPWIVVTIHRPFLCSDTVSFDEHKPGAAEIAAFEPLLIRYGVDLTLAGHQHWYERVHPTINGSVVSRPSSSGIYRNPKAPVHLTVGTGGAAIWPEAVQPQPAWSAVRFGGPLVIGGFGFMRVEVHNATHLYAEFVEADLEPRHQDNFWIVKGQPATMADLDADIVELTI